MRLSAVASKVLLALLALAGALRMGFGVLAWRAANALEQPAYTVLRSLPGGVELRQYAPYLIAEAEVAAPSMREGSARGFRTCAAYLFGKNSARGAAVKMAMTAPVRAVQTASAAAERVKVSFVVPSKYTPRTAPTPLDGDVRVRQLRPHALAVRAFSGPPPSERRVAAERAALVAALDAAGVPLAAGEEGEETLVYGYHDPFFTPGFLRRNEVAVRVQA
ncbi:hypothetical protein AB1Y20_016225 [Prymnesium parvum]|uniref:SOUL heme-binding protein n=1 Tax=Prymnesium parvum TaxID=97485 RepID=A0AB34IDB8_PRYPA